MPAEFTRTDTILDRILADKLLQIEAQKQQVSPVQMRDLALAARNIHPPKNFAAALLKENVALIAEVKKASPSRGVLVESFEPVALAQVYEANGASAISVLTDEKYFMGHIDYLREIRAAVAVPLLRKDFMLDTYQIDEARAAGADACLLIVAALCDDQLKELHHAIVQLGMTALVEVHDDIELKRALDVGASIIGVNNRDLHTFEVNLTTTHRLAAQVTEGTVLVAESGIRSTDDIVTMGRYGASAILVGETLVCADDVSATVAAFASQPKQTGNAAIRPAGSVGRASHS